jgi:pentose-5-phosphate-3-epimerase
MIRPVERLVPDFEKAGANILTFHPKPSEHVEDDFYRCSLGVVLPAFTSRMCTI